MRNLRSTALCLLAAAALLQACAPAARGQAQVKVPAETQHRLFMPWANLALDVELPGLIMGPVDMTEDPQAKTSAPAGNQSNGVGPERRAREFFIMFAPTKGGPPKFFGLRIRMEPAPDGAAAAALRDAAAAHYAKAKNVSRESVKQDEYKQTPLLRYKLSDGGGLFIGYGAGYNSLGAAYPSAAFGLPSSFRVLEAFAAHDGAAVTLRLMSSEIKEKEEQLFYAILDSLRFVDTSRPSSSYDYFTLGRELFRRKEYVASAAALVRALALERQKRELTQARWREMVLYLANALGAAKEYDRSRDVLEYGAADDPTYANFHYGLSRLYSYAGDLDRALAALERTYQNMPKGKYADDRWLVDPLEDVAFLKFADDPKFRDAVKALKKKYKK